MINIKCFLLIIYCKFKNQHSVELLDNINIKKNKFSIQINEIYVASYSEFHRKLKIKTPVFKM